MLKSLGECRKEFESFSSSFLRATNSYVHAIQFLFAPWRDWRRVCSNGSLMSNEDSIQRASKIPPQRAFKSRGGIVCLTRSARPTEVKKDRMVLLLQQQLWRAAELVRSPPVLMDEGRSDRRGGPSRPFNSRPSGRGLDSSHGLWPLTVLTGSTVG